MSVSEATTVGSIARSGSTKVVAALMLILMVALAIIAVLVVQSSASGRMRLELNVASWITAMLFALLPIRGFLPGDPPIGSWIDILVFFWVEATIMVCGTRCNRSAHASARKATQLKAGQTEQVTPTHGEEQSSFRENVIHPVVGCFS